MKSRNREDHWVLRNCTCMGLLRNCVCQFWCKSCRHRQFQTLYCISRWLKLGCRGRDRWALCHHTSLKSLLYTLLCYHLLGKQVHSNNICRWFRSQQRGSLRCQNCSPASTRTWSLWSGCTWADIFWRRWCGHQVKRTSSRGYWRIQSRSYTVRKFPSAWSTCCGRASWCWHGSSSPSRSPHAPHNSSSRSVPNTSPPCTSRWCTGNPLNSHGPGSKVTWSPTLKHSTLLSCDTLSMNHSQL